MFVGLRDLAPSPSMGEGRGGSDDESGTGRHQLTTSSRGAWLTGSQAPSVTIAVSPRCMASPVYWSSMIMCMKKTMPGARTCGLPVQNMGQSIQVGG